MFVRGVNMCTYMYYPVDRPTRCTPFFIILHNRITFRTISSAKHRSFVLWVYIHIFFIVTFITFHKTFFLHKKKTQYLHNSLSPYGCAISFCFMCGTCFNINGYKLMLREFCMMLKTFLFILFLDGKHSQVSLDVINKNSMYQAYSG